MTKLHPGAAASFTVLVAVFATVASSPATTEASSCCECLAKTSPEGTAAGATNNCLPDDAQEASSCETQSSAALNGDSAAINTTAESCTEGCLSECAAAIKSGVVIKASDRVVATSLNGVGYSSGRTYLSYDDASALCEDAGGTLATVDDPAIASLLGSFAFGWIGLTDRAQEGTYAWEGSSETTDASDESWQDTRPDDDDVQNDEDCVEFSDGRWNDDVCDDLHPAICEFP
jgi:hypothetical protein